MNKIAYDDRKAVYERAIRKYGAARQTLKAIEEMAELTKELCKYHNEDDMPLEGIAEEIADVTIMLEQLRIIYDINDDVCVWMDAKIKRLNDRLKSR